MLQRDFQVLAKHPVPETESIGRSVDDEEVRLQLVRKVECGGARLIMQAASIIGDITHACTLDKFFESFIFTLIKLTNVLYAVFHLFFLFELLVGKRMSIIEITRSQIGCQAGGNIYCLFRTVAIFYSTMYLLNIAWFNLWLGEQEY